MLDFRQHKDFFDRSHALGWERKPGRSRFPSSWFLDKVSEKTAPELRIPGIFGLMLEILASVSLREMYSFLYLAKETFLPRRGATRNRRDACSRSWPCSGCIHIQAQRQLPDQPVVLAIKSA